jgi:hypothetical protein
MAYTRITLSLYSFVFRVIMRFDVSGLPIGSIFKGQTVQKQRLYPQTDDSELPIGSKMSKKNKKGEYLLAHIDP